MRRPATGPRRQVLLRLTSYRGRTTMTETADRQLSVLFLFNSNSARSIMAEAILTREGMGRFKAYSAGSYPRGEVNPIALDVLRKLDYDVSTFRSKGWEEFSGPDAPPLDFVFTVCDDTATRSVRSGPVIRLRRIGAFPIPPPSPVRTRSITLRSTMPTICCSTASRSSPLCRCTASSRSACRRSSTPSARIQSVPGSTRRLIRTASTPAAVVRRDD